MKKNVHVFRAILSTIVVAIISMFHANAQTVSITSNPGTSGNIVLGGSNYHASESIFLASEIGTTNFITTATAINHIDFSINTVGASPSVSNFSIYLKEVAAATTTLAASTYSLTGYTLVFNGTYDVSSTGWKGVDLATSFKRNGTRNLQVLIIRNDNVVHSGNIFNASVGNTTGGNAVTSTRRYNGTVAPAAGSSQLTASAFRPAIQFVHTVATNAGLSTYSIPIVSCYGNPVSVGVVVKNAGTQTVIGAGEATVNLTVSGANPYTTSASNTGAIAVGDTQSVYFSGIDLTNTGSNSFTAIVSFTGDQDKTNDTLKFNLATAPVLNGYPLSEDVESNLPVLSWVKVRQGTRQLWRIVTSAYGNVGMPDSLYAHGGSKFFLFDSYSGANSTGTSVNLYSNCLDLTAGNGYNVHFFMSHDTSTDFADDSLYVNVSTDKGATWTRIAGFQRFDPTFTLPDWREDSVDLTPYAGKTIQIGFEGVSNYGNAIGLDDITINEVVGLPLKLISFNAQKAGKSVKLSWTTGEEINTSRFSVERSADGEVFKAIGSIAAAGSSHVDKSYNYADIAPLKGNNFYRLKMIDIDGKSKYSPIRYIKNDGNTDINVYPNPVTDIAHLDISTEKAGNATIVITDLAGRTIYSSIYNLNEGLNSINLSLNKLGLAKGNFILKLQANEKTIIKTITKL